MNFNKTCVEAGEYYLIKLLLGKDNEFNRNVSIIQNKYKLDPKKGIKKLGKNYIEITPKHSLVPATGTFTIKDKVEFIYESGKIKKIPEKYYKDVQSLCNNYFIPDNLFNSIYEYVGSGACPRFMTVKMKTNLPNSYYKKKKFIPKAYHQNEIFIPKYANKKQRLGLQKLETNHVSKQLYDDSVYMPNAHKQLKKTAQVKRKTKKGIYITTSVSLGRDEIQKIWKKNQKKKEDKNTRGGSDLFDDKIRAYRLATIGDKKKSYTEIHEKLFNVKNSGYKPSDIKKWVENIGIMIDGLQLIKAKK